MLRDVHRLDTTRDASSERGRRPRRRSTLAIGGVGLVALGVTLAPTLGAPAGASSGNVRSQETSAASTPSLKKAIRAAEALPKFVAPAPPIDVSRVRGDEVLLMVGATSGNEVLLQAAEGAQQAAKLVGLNAKLVITSTVVSALDESLAVALQEHPKAVITFGYEPELESKPMQALRAAHIPIVDVLNDEPNKNIPGQGGGPNVYAVSTGSYYTNGTLVGDYVCSKDPKAQIGVIVANYITGSKFIDGGFTSALKRYCPSAKVVDTTDVEPTKWVTTLGPATSGIISSHPSVNYIMPVIDAMSPYVGASIESLHKVGKVRIIDTAGTVGALLKSVKTGKIVVADAGPSNGWLGWNAVNQAIRGILGKAPGNPTVPSRLFTPTDLKHLNPTSSVSVFGDPYEAGFKSLWGLHG